MRRKPRANSLTYRQKKNDGVTMQMSFDMARLTTSNCNSNHNSGSEEDVV